MSNYDIELAKDMGQFFDDPLGFVMYAFNWTDDKSIQKAELKEPYATRYNSKYGPDLWACEFLEEIGEGIRERGFDGSHPVKDQRYATSSGHGIGKSAITSWLILYILSTRPHSQN